MCSWFLEEGVGWLLLGGGGGGSCIIVVKAWGRSSFGGELPLRTPSPD